MTQGASFEKTESTISNELDDIGEYHDRNHLRAKQEKIQTCIYRIQPIAPHLVLRKRHTSTPTYLGVILDRTLRYSTHITKIKEEEEEKK